MFNVSACGIFSGNNLSGISNHDGVIRNIKIDVGQRCDQHVLPDGDVSNNNGVCTDPHIVLNCRTALSGTPVFLADGHTGGDINIFSQDCIRVDNNSSAMTNVESFPDFNIVGDLDVGLSGQLLQAEFIVDFQQSGDMAVDFSEAVEKFDLIWTENPLTQRFFWCSIVTK